MHLEVHSHIQNSDEGMILFAPFVFSHGVLNWTHLTRIRGGSLKASPSCDVLKVEEEEKVKCEGVCKWLFLCCVLIQIGEVGMR